MSVDFESEEVRASIPSRSSYAPSDKQKSYLAGDTLRFHIPAFQSFIDPRMTTLNFKIKVENAVSLVRFSNKCGLHSLIDVVRVYDANTNLQLETLQNYAEMAQKFHLYSENQSIRNKRGLIEGLEYTSRNFDGEYYDNFPARNCDQSQLFHHKYKTGADGTYTADVAPGSEPNTIEVALHLYSGVLGALSNKMFPAIICNGLRIEIDTNDPMKCLEQWTMEGVVNNTGGRLDVGAGDTSRFGIIAPTPTTANPLTSIKLYTEKQAGYNQNPTATNFPTQASLDDDCVFVKNQLVGAVNLVPGVDLYGWTNANPPAWVKMGKIESVSCNAGEDTGGEVAITVNFVADPTNANGDLFVGGAGRDNTGAVQESKNNTCGVREADLFSNNNPRILISDVQFIVKTAQPPQSYINSMMKQLASAEGVNYDFLTLDTYRNNVLGGERVVQLNIPTLNHRATSILTLPVNNAQAQALQHNNLDTVIDDADNYNYLIDNKLQPTRRVRLSQLSQTVPKTEQVALFEWEKALSAVKIHPKNLDYQETNFAIGRHLSRYGGVYDLASTGNASLRVQYGNNTNKNKLMITYIGGLRRLIVNKDGRYIET
jgi:hypothetical protein